VTRCKYYRRKDVRSERYVVYLDYKGKRWTRTYFDDRLSICAKPMARELCSEISADYRRNPKTFDPLKWFRVRLSEMRFRNYADRWLDRRDIEESSYQVYRHILNEALEVLGDLDIRDIRKSHLRDYVEGLSKDLSPNTVRYKLSVLNILFRDAYNDEEINRTPGFPKIKAVPVVTRWLNYEEQQQVLEHIPEPDKPIFKFMTYYGCRVGEAVALMWDCVDWRQGVVTIKRTLSANKIRESRKTGNVLCLPLTDEMEALLRPLRSLRKFVFTNRYGRRYYRQNLLRTCNIACEKAGFERLSLHELCRHSKGGQLINQDVPLEQISALLGHKHTNSTKRYIKIKTETLKPLVEHPVTDR